MVISPPLFATWLGYLTGGLALAALGLTVAALWLRRDDLERLGGRSILVTGIVVIAATIHGLASYVVTFASRHAYTQLFLAASLFTLALALSDWRSRDVEVLWKEQNRAIYLSGYVGCLALAMALIWMG